MTRQLRRASYAPPRMRDRRAIPRPISNAVAVGFGIILPLAVLIGCGAIYLAHHP